MVANWAVEILLDRNQPGRSMRRHRRQRTDPFSFTLLLASATPPVRGIYQEPGQQGLTLLPPLHNLAPLTHRGHEFNMSPFESPSCSHLNGVFW